MKENIKGQIVVVKDFRGLPFLRIVVEIVENVVFITSEREYKRLILGEKHLWPIGVPLADVYEYDGKPLHEKVDWKQMTSWTPK